LAFSGFSPSAAGGRRQRHFDARQDGEQRRASQQLVQRLLRGEISE
jgi:hypothetical protein